MLHALEHVGFRSFVLAALVAAAATVYVGHHHHCTKSQEMHRLVLDAPIEAHAIYLTAWAEGDVWMPLDLSTPQTITFSTRALIDDGCRWLGTEVLEPIDQSHFAYSYSEQILSCEPGAVPYVKTPRTGVVTVAE